MNLSTALMFGQAATSLLTAPGKIKGAKKVATAQKQTLEKYYNYNKEQISKAYDNSFKNMMNSHIANRNSLSDRTKEVNSQINSKVSQEEINISSSSYSDDIKNQLDFEYNVGLQDLTTSQANQISNIIAGMTTQQLQLEQQYSNQLNNINSVEQNVIDKSKNDIFGDLLNAGISGFDSYSNYKSINTEGSFGNWLTTFNTPKKLGGK